MKAVGWILAAAALAAAARGQDGAPDLRFGVMTHFAQGADPAAIGAIATAGIPTVRDELYWDIVEPRADHFTFPASYDAYLSRLQRAGIAPLIVLDFANHNYDGNATPYDPAGFAGYARYAAVVLQHYGAQIGAVEIWNEYNGSFCTGPALKDRTGTYLQMLKEAYARIKAVRPGVTVAAGSTAGLPMPYWEKLLAGGALASLDVLSIHPYRYDSAPEGLEDDIGDLRDLERKYNGGKTKPIWVTEIGWATKAGSAADQPAVDDATQAKYLVRADVLLLSAGVERIYWYDFRDTQGEAMGLLKGDAANTPKPAYFALENLIRRLHGAPFVRREPTPPDIYSLLFRRPDGTDLRVLWSLTPVSLAVTGATGETDLFGHYVAPAPQLRLGDSPVFVSGRLAGLPPPPPCDEAPLTVSRRDFSSRQGDHGWSYGTFDAKAAFQPLTQFVVTDSTEEWTGDFPYMAVGAEDQHPSAAGATPVPAVRRWISNHDGPVHLTGYFQCGMEGDGVGASVLVGGRRIFRQLLGGGSPIRKNFDLVEQVRTGEPIDFAVDPGPDRNIDYDATLVDVTIRAPRGPAAPVAGSSP